MLTDTWGGYSFLGGADWVLQNSSLKLGSKKNLFFLREICFNSLCLNSPCVKYIQLKKEPQACFFFPVQQVEKDKHECQEVGTIEPLMRLKAPTAL